MDEADDAPTGMTLSHDIATTLQNWLHYPKREITELMARDGKLKLTSPI